MLYLYNNIHTRQIFKELINVDAVLYIKPPTRRQIKKSYNTLQRDLNQNPPEFFIEYMTDIQYIYQIYDRSFGTDILRQIAHTQGEKIMEFWDYVNITIDYVTQTLGLNWEISNDILKRHLMEDDFIIELLDQILTFYKSTCTRFYIDWEEFIELYMCSLEAIELKDDDKILIETILFLEEIGLIFPIKRKKFEPFAEKFIIGWSRHTIEIFKEVVLKDIKKIENHNEDINDLLINNSSIKINLQITNNIQTLISKFKWFISRKNLKRISENSGVTIKDIKQRGKELKYKYKGIISDKVALYLSAEEYKKKAPLCKFKKKDGSQCQKRTKDDSGYCHHHRPNL